MPEPGNSAFGVLAYAVQHVCDIRVGCMMSFCYCFRQRPTQRRFDVKPPFAPYG